jgi:hypothetical protein
MRLIAPEETRPVVERVHEIYAMHCPLYRTFHQTLHLTSSCTLVQPTSRQRTIGHVNGR